MIPDIESSPQSSQVKSPVAYMPAEWVQHEAVYLAWPADKSLWQENLELAQSEFTLLCRQIADVDPFSGERRGEQLRILVTDVEAEMSAKEALAGLGCRFERIPYGDIWLRDTAPLFLLGKDPTAFSFRFNGWGEKYVLPFDAQVAQEISKNAQTENWQLRKVPFICEGGSLEFDGEGTCLTSEQCLLNPNRNPEYSRTEIEELLKKEFALQKVIWVKDGMLNDHTDGHIDTIARFIAPAHVVIHEPASAEDPNYKQFVAIREALEGQTDACGRKLKISTILSPNRVENEDGDVMPASYVNFYISNTKVIVPLYGVANDAQAVIGLQKLFKDREVVGIYAKAILSGGGSFHCITQQVPVRG